MQKKSPDPTKEERSGSLPHPTKPVIAAKLRFAASALSEVADQFEKGRLPLPPPSDALEIEDILDRVEEMTAWEAEVKARAQLEAEKGKQWEGWTLSPKRTRRRYINTDAVIKAAKKAKVDPFEHRLMSVSALEKKLGKARFDALIAPYVYKPVGELKLVKTKEKTKEDNK